MVKDAEKTAETPAVKKLILVYPILFSIFPILSIYSANLAVVPFPMVVRPIVVVSLTVLVLWGVFSLILRNAARAAAAVSSLVAMTFLYTNVQKVSWTAFYVPHDYEFPLWVILTIIVVAVFAWKFTLHRLANFLSVALILTSSAQVVIGLAKSAQLKPKEAPSISHGNRAVGKRPDIYYVILDGYGRSDALQRALNFDNHSFIDGLESRGFYVAKDSKSNYCQTELSVASSLNFDSIQNLLTKVSPKEIDRMPLGELINHNAAAQYLKEKGYQFAAITTGFPPLQFESADVNMRSKAGLSMIESALIQLTPIGNMSKTIENMHVRRREDLNLAFESFARLHVKDDKPRFVVVHILAPHPPFVFGPNGEAVDQGGAYGFWDGSDYIEHVSTAENYRTGYAGQATFIGKQMLKALDKILESEGEKPVILIQGDHGSKMRLDQNSLAKTDLNECFPNLSAYLVPDEVRKNLYPSITPVNSFRVLFNGLFNEQLPIRDDKSWYSTFPLPYAFTEVTDKVADHLRLPSVPLPK